MKLYFCGRRAILEGDVQPFEREEIDQYRLKLPLQHRHKINVSELVLSTIRGEERQHTTAVLTPTNFGDIRLQYIIS